MNLISKSILQTLSYSDNFLFPLTKEEIFRWLGVKTTPRDVELELKKLLGEKKVFKKDNLYFLPKREITIENRRRNKIISQEKYLLAKKTAKTLEKIPWIAFIGITGSLAVENCREEDDIDLIIVTKKNRLWIVRFLIIILGGILGIKRRKQGDTIFKDKICFNLFLDEESLKIEKINYLISRELLQIKLLFDSGRVSDRIISDNPQVLSFFPNYPENTENITNYTEDNNVFLDLINKILFKLQYWYMRSKITNEKVCLHQAFFHPRGLGKGVKNLESRI